MVTRKGKYGIRIWPGAGLATMTYWFKTRKERDDDLTRWKTEEIVTSSGRVKATSVFRLIRRINP